MILSAYMYEECYFPLLPILCYLHGSTYPAIYGKSPQIGHVVRHIENTVDVFDLPRFLYTVAG